VKDDAPMAQRPCTNSDVATGGKSYAKGLLLNLDGTSDGVIDGTLLGTLDGSIDGNVLGLLEGPELGISTVLNLPQ